MSARVFIKYGSMVALVVSLYPDGRYYSGTYLPETRKVVDIVSGRMLKSPEDTAEALLGMGYGEAPASLDPQSWMEGGAK